MKNTYPTNFLTNFGPMFTAFAFVLLFSAKANAGSVKDINASKSQIVVDLKEDEAAADDTICVFNTKNKKIDCGNVTRVKKSFAYVKFASKKNLKKIKKGYRTTVGDDPAATAATSDKSSGFKLWFGYMPAVLTPAVFSHLGYVSPDSETPETLWEEDSAATSSLVGFGLQAGIGIGSMSIVPGLRYRIYDTKNINANYSTGRINPYVNTTTSGSAIGFYTDVIFLDKSMGSMTSIFASSGLDVDMSTVTLKAEKKDDTGATAEGSVASAKSSLTVISLRLGGGINLIPVKPFGVSIGLNALVPIMEVGKKFAGSLEEEESRGMVEPGDDLKEKLGHKKNGFGLDAQVTVLLAF